MQHCESAIHDTCQSCSAMIPPWHRYVLTSHQTLPVRGGAWTVVPSAVDARVPVAVRRLLERERGERRARLDGPEGDALESLPLSRQSASVFAVPSASFKVRLQQYSAGATQTSRAPRHTTLNTIHKTQKQRLCTSACCNRGTFCPAPADSGPASQPRPLQSRRPRPLQPLWALAPGGARSRAPAHACDELALRVQVIAQCR